MLVTRRSFGQGSHCTEAALIRLSQLMQHGWLLLRRPCYCTGITQHVQLYCAAEDLIGPLVDGTMVCLWSLGAAQPPTYLLL